MNRHSGLASLRIGTVLRGALLAWALATGAPAGVLAAPAPPAVRAEIDALLARLAASGCEFERNGRWHDAAEARSHLQRKLDHVERRGTLRSTEQFIELAATSSSTSGRAYQVRCGGNAVPSANWLARELAALRAARPAPASNAAPAAR
jgi:hypothetical protein